ncbi:unnamed protein product, partial [Vitis vinifera]
MRAGACTLQQTLTTEAASVLKHSLSLARRRGHAQVTPLHVAATLLSSRASLLRRACLKSQPNQSTHPLQCRALELCFNVALNRLPTTPGPLLHGQPSLSNALIAALKRAQAHQRRGCIEQQQQQPLLTIKVELEQLIISILDDPSVSRVMREAGFSSTAVKNNLEDSSASSVFQCYNIINPSTFWQTHILAYSSEQNPLLFSPQKKLSSNPITDSTSVKEDLKLVLEVLLRKKRRNTVIVGDSVSTTEGLVAELMGRIERGEVPEELKSAHFVKFQFSPVTLRFMKREEVEMNLSDLKRKVDSLASGGGGGAIIYAGDLKWTVEAAVSDRDGGFPNGEASAYNPIDHLVAEIGRLLSDYTTSNTRVWLMATASYQTYMRCQMKQPSLEIQWALQAVSVPSGGLGLSLHASSVHDSRSQNQAHHVLETKPFAAKEEHDKLSCCAECTANYEKEVGLFKSGQQKLLPSWLQAHGVEARQKDDLVELRRKWNRLCHSLHQGSYSYTSSYPWWPNQNSIFPDLNSISFTNSALKPNHASSLVPRFRRQQSCHIEFSFGNGMHKQQSVEPSLDCLKKTEGKDVKITLALGTSVYSDSGKLPELKGEKTIRLRDICKLLEENVPWQSEAISPIAEALIDSKSSKKETWLLLQGNDSIGKRRLAHAIAESVFGSADLVFRMNMRKLDNGVTPCSEILTEALRAHQKLVVMVEDVDFAEPQFMKFLADGCETGEFRDSSKREGSFGQAIFILTTGDSSSYQERKGNKSSVIHMKLQINLTIPTLGTPNMDHKRKADCLISVEPGNSKILEFTRQLSFNTLDLNIRADEDDESKDKPRELSPISSDLTRETATDIQNPHGFLESIENRFTFKRKADQDREMREAFLSKIKGSFEVGYDSENTVSFSVEQKLLEEVLAGCDSFLNSLFEKWLKEVFQTSVKTVKIGGKEGMEVRLRLVGKGEKGLEDGFMGSSLPKKIQVSFMD